MIGFQSNLIGMYIFLKLLGMNHASISVQLHHNNTDNITF